MRGGWTPSHIRPQGGTAYGVNRILGDDHNAHMILRNHDVLALLKAIMDSDRISDEPRDILLLGVLRLESFTVKWAPRNSEVPCSRGFYEGDWSSGVSIWSAATAVQALGIHWMKSAISLGVSAARDSNHLTE